MQGSAAPRITLEFSPEGEAMTPGRRADVRPTYFLLFGPVGPPGRGFGPEKFSLLPARSVSFEGAVGKR